jgi:methionyl-tRNA synthetase
LADPEKDDALVNMAASLWQRYEKQMESYAFQNALSEIFHVISRANKYIDENAPWVLAKDEAKKARLARVMYNLLDTVRICGALVEPVMPDTTKKIMERIGAAEFGWDSLATFGVLAADTTVTAGDALFPRIDLAKELAELDALQEAAAKAAQAPAEDPLPEPLPPVDFDTFCKVEMTVVKVKSCEKVKKSNKLLKFQLDDGTGTDRQILSGIAKFYKPEELVGKTLVAITNLPPRKMMGRESCGMLISAVHTVNGEEKLNLLMVDDAIPAGAKLC